MLAERLRKTREAPLVDERIPHPYREMLTELRAIRAALERPAAVPGVPPTIRIPGVPPAPAPSEYVDVFAHGLRRYGSLLLADDLYVETIDLGVDRSTAAKIQEFATLSGVALTIFRCDGSFDLYLNEKDDKHKIDITALTYPQTFLIDWCNIKTIFVGNSTQSGKSAKLIAWKPVGPPPAIPPPKPLLAITPGDYETFHKLGDVNRDGIIDDRDLVLLKAAFGSKPGMPNWNPDCDLNGDGVVDIRDVTTASTHYGLTIEKWKAGR